MLGAFVSAASSGLPELNDRLRGRERPDAALAANGSCASGTDGGGLIVSGTGIAADRSDARVRGAGMPIWRGGARSEARIIGGGSEARSIGAGGLGADTGGGIIGGGSVNDS